MGEDQHGFTFLGMMNCADCASAITAQFARGRHGGIYRYYRCTKKRGHCSQGYIQEKDLVAQVRSKIEQVSICDEWNEAMLAKVKEWENAESCSSLIIARNLQERITETQVKLDRLVSSYLDGDIPKDIYLPKKEALLTQKMALTGRLRRADEERGKSWIEPLKDWLEAANTASELVSSNNFEEMRRFVQKHGSNPLLSDKKLVFSYSAPWSIGLCIRAKPVIARSRAGK